MQGWSRHATGRYVGGEVGSGSCCSLWSGRIEREARHGAAGSAHAIALHDGESARKGFFGSRIIAAACRHGIFDTAAKQHSTEMIMCSLLSGRSFDSSGGSTVGGELPNPLYYGRSSLRTHGRTHKHHTERPKTQQTYHGVTTMDNLVDSCVDTVVQAKLPFHLQIPTSRALTYVGKHLHSQSVHDRSISHKVAQRCPSWRTTSSCSSRISAENQ